MYECRIQNDLSGAEVLVRTTCSNSSMHALTGKLRDSIELVISVTCSVGYAHRKKKGEENK